MYTVSAHFLDALRSPSMRVVTSVQAVDSDGIPQRLAVVDGSVTMNATRAIVRTCDLQLTATDTLSVQEVFDLVMSPGVEVRVERGLQLDGGPELVPLGVFSTDQASLSRRVTGAVSWAGSDRSKKVARARFISPYVVASGGLLRDALTDLILSRAPSVAVDLSSVSGTVRSSVVLEAGAQSDPWKDARTIAAAYGLDLAFDGAGTLRARAIPDPSTGVVAFDFGEGETNLVLDATVSGTLENTYNGVIASGEGTEVAAPVRAVVWDDDPSSPTYYLGGFGQVPYFYSSPQLTTVEQCELAATTLLARVKGRRSGLSWSTVVNPALEPLDVVATHLRGRSSRVVLDGLVMPLRASVEGRAVARELEVAA